MQELKDRLFAMRKEDAPNVVMADWAPPVVPGLELADVDALMSKARGRGREEGREQGWADFEQRALPARVADAETRGALAVLEILVDRVQGAYSVNAPAPDGEDSEEDPARRNARDTLLSIVAALRSHVGHNGATGERGERRNAISARW